jgi:hypothetical protein
VHHRLLVARLVIGEQLLVLLERLAEPGQVAVAEDAEAAGEEAAALAVALDLLDGEKAHQRLGDGQPHVRTSCGSMSSRVGIASAHASRAATYAPAALASRIVRSSGHSASSP